MSGFFLRALLISAMMTLAGATAAALKPTAPPMAAAPDLDALLPAEFGPWRRIDLSDAVLPAELELGPGEAVAYRAYVDDIGRVVTLVAAYGPPLGDSVRLHRPEKCYAAQGFAIRARETHELGVDGRVLPIVHLDAESPSRREAVTYWLRNGGNFTTNASDSGWLRLRSNVLTPLDGALVRVSTINAETPQFALHRQFLAEFSQALSDDARALLLGGRAGA